MNKQKGFAPILIVVIITVLVGGYLIYQNQPKLTPTSTAQFTSAPTSTPKSTNSAKTANWKTYINLDKLYSLEYPADTFNIKEENLTANSACKTELLMSDKATGFPDKYQGIIVLDVCKADSKFFPQMSFGNITGSETQQNMINNNVAYSKIGEATFEKLGSRVTVKRVVSYKNGYVYSFDLRFIPGSKDYTQEFNQILSTFKFLP